MIEARRLLTEWREKQGHDACWYYPEVFEQLCSLFSVPQQEQNLLSHHQFKMGCERYQARIFKCDRCMHALDCHTLSGCIIAGCNCTRIKA